MAISYDTRATLSLFSRKHGITFPVLPDSQSQIIRRFGLLNPRGLGFTAGMAIPGYFYVGADRRIRETFFEDEDNNRYTPNNIIAKLFPELVVADERNISAPHLSVKLAQSDTAVIPGFRLTLAAAVSLPPDVHVYAPGVQGGYKAIALELQPSPGVVLRQLTYPPSRVMLVPAIGEKVPVFEGTFRITADIMIAQGDHLINEQVANGPTTLTVSGTLRYQACDSTLCYPPNAVPVSWNVTVHPVVLTEGKGDARAGRNVFRRRCETCHGQSGVGNSKMTWNAGGTLMPVRPLNSVTPGMSDGEMRHLIPEGYGPVMQPVRGLSQAEVQNVIAYVRSLEKKPRE